MKLQIIQKNEQLLEAIPHTGGVLEVTEKIENDDRLCNLDFYHLDENTLFEISPDLRKTAEISICNCIPHSDYVYFATTNDDENNDIVINIYSFDLKEKVPSFLFSFNVSAEFKKLHNIIKVFAMSETQFLVQTEQKRNKDIQELMGNIEFNQKLYNVESGDVVKIIDQNLINNGINTIHPLDNGNVLIKTGFSFLEDERISGTTEDEALIEGVYFGNMSLFVSSLGNESATTGLKLLATAYFDKCILTPSAQDNFVFYTVYDHLSKISETYFYDYVNDTQIVFKNENAEAHKLGNLCVINNTPYVYAENDGKIRFLNLKNNDFDCVFFDEKFVKAVGGILIFYKSQGNYNYIRIYRHPKLDLIHEEKGYLNFACKSGENYYIYIK